MLKSILFWTIYWELCLLWWLWLVTALVRLVFSHNVLADYEVILIWPNLFSIHRIWIGYKPHLLIFTY